MRSAGMFKALICDENGEYTFPFIPENYLLIKRAVFVMLLGLLGYFIGKPPVLISDVNTFTDVSYVLSERVDEFGMTRLHRAVINGNINVIKILIRNGAGLNKTDNYGWAPLHWASFLGREDLMEILITNGAKQKIRSTSDWFVFKKGSLPSEVSRKL